MHLAAIKHFDRGRWEVRGGGGRQRIDATTTGRPRMPAGGGSDVTRYVALLRGINVGKNKRIPMPGLRDALEAAGYTDVRTLLVSGNVVLTPPDERGADEVADDVSRVVRENWGHDVRVVVRTVDELRAAVDACPVPEPENGSRFFVAFLSATPAELPPPEVLGDDAWWTADREIY